MRLVIDGYRSLRFLVVWNFDRLMWPIAIATALGVGQYLGGF